ncbi:MAG: right-handed parallel beta-helix repeat-containing protein [Pseudomonadota bacterium]
MKVKKPMRILRYSLALLALCHAAPSWAKSASDYFPICTAPGTAAGRTLTVDPSSRSAGSLSTIDAAMKAARPGDVISLMTGDYGELKITGANQGGFITIAAAPGQSPRFTKLTISASHWRLTGLTVTGHLPQGVLVNIGDSNNIIFEKNIIASKLGNIAWGPALIEKANPEGLSSGIFANQSSCISVTDNRISNVFNALMTGGDQVNNRGKYLLINGNIIDNFAGDGIDHQASHIRIEGNHITNGHDICNNQCIHNDGIQGWTWGNRPGVVNTDVVISNNEIVVQADPKLVLPADAFQGITIFNGEWDGVQITNNVIVATAWHGITVFRARNVSIVNNTVAPGDPKRNTWITYSPPKDLPPGTSNHSIMRNNVAREVGIYKHEPVGENIEVDHNLAIKSAEGFSDVFVKFDLQNSSFDLHPSRRSDAKGEGFADGAPTADIEGNPRKGAVDIGAYSYSGK